MPPTEQPDELARRELRVLLDEELQLLPAVERDLLILCDMQGRTQTEAAVALNCPPGSVSRLLSGARNRLRSRLARRGVGVPVAVLTAVLAQHGHATVPARLCAAAVRAALLQAAGAGSSGAAELAQQVLPGPAVGRAKALAVGLLAVSLAGAGAFAFRSGAPAESHEPAAAAPAVPGVRGSAPVFRHGAAVTALAVAPDGRVASAAADRVVRVWDHESGRELIRFAAPPEGVAALAFSPDRNELLVEDPRVGLAIWFLDTGKRRKNHLGQWAGVEALAYSADGTRLATVGRDGRLIALDLTVPQSTQRASDWAVQERAAKVVRRLFAPTDPAARARHSRGVAFTADGGAVYALDRALTLTRMDARSGRVERSELEPEPKGDGPATTVAVSPGARWAAWGTGDRRVGLAELPSGPVHFLGGHSAAVVALAFAPDGGALASVDAGGRLIHTKLPAPGGRFESRGATFRFRASVLAVAPGGGCVYGAGAGGEVHRWDATALDPIPPVRER